MQHFKKNKRNVGGHESVKDYVPMQSRDYFQELLRSPQ